MPSVNQRYLMMKSLLSYHQRAVPDLPKASTGNLRKLSTASADHQNTGMLLSDYRVLFPFGCLGNFRRTKDSKVHRGKFDCQGLLGIALGRSEFTNGMVFYNPTLDSFSVSVDFILDRSRTLSDVFPSVIYDGGLTTSVMASD